MSKELGARFRTWRGKSKTQKQAGELFGVDKSTVAHWESGRKKPNLLRAADRVPEPNHRLHLALLGSLRRWQERNRSRLRYQQVQRGAGRQHQAWRAAVELLREARAGRVWINQSRGRVKTLATVAILFLAAFPLAVYAVELFV